jgi:glycine/serine hydroxymethyltransferase
LKEKEILKIADIIDKALKNWKNEEMLKKLKEEVLEICNQYKLWY